MDVKQFNLLQTTMQFAQDELREAWAENRDSSFDMDDWFDYTDETLLADAFANKTKTTHVGRKGEALWALPTLAAGTCGTSACLAGTAVLLNGEDQVLVMPQNSIVDLVLLKDGRTMAFQDRGRALLGLTHADADDLFFRSADTEEEWNALVERATKIAARHGHTLELI